MNSITECLNRINHLTQQNLDILKTLNDSFFTKKEHLVVNVDDNRYVIPSYVALENKVNALQEGLNNLVNAPLTGEAYFNYDGNSKTIEVRGFNNTPNSITLHTADTEKFFVEYNSIFKDFITPNAHLKFGVTSLPDDINTVLVKKVVPLTDEANNLFKSLLLKDEDTQVYDKSKNIQYSELYKKLSILTLNTDYEEYSVVRSLPVRQSIGTGTYVITKIISDEIQSDLTERLVLEFSKFTPLVYKKFDETIDVYLEPGMYLTTYDDRVKLQVVEVNERSNQLVLNVVNGDYLDLVAYSGEITEETDINDIQGLSKLRFFSVNDFSKDKYVDVTLEENQYIAVFIAPLNSRMNIQAPWGNGLVIDTWAIKKNDELNVDYHSFYKEYVKNIGDTLKELVYLTSGSSITKYNEDEFNSFSEYKPVINLENLDVIQINKHLNDSPTIQKIRDLYSQKKQYEIDLTEIQGKITSINSTLASVSFDDTTNMRTIYESQLDEFTKKKNEVVSAINSVVNEISLAVNSSDVPIENAKYHIRGYFDWNTSDNILDKYKDHIKRIDVQYRYKNKDKVTGSASSFQNGKFIYSDWNRMENFDRKMRPEYKDNQYKFEYEENTDAENVPSFNQIDIPISQGESVDIRLKIVWDFGYPYIESTSDWSEIVNIEFPEEYLKDVPILTIIEENNNDIETNRFKDILIDNGVMTHVDDRQIDQDLTYFHHPEHIASGFYTEERRVIPLKDKLSSMDNAIINLEDTVFGSNSENIKVEFIFDSTSTLILPDQDNVVNVNVDVAPSPQDESEISKYQYIANLQITNLSTRSVRMFSIFPGNRDIDIEQSGYGKYDKDQEYRIDLLASGFYSEQSGNYGGASRTYEYKTQVRNQFLYLRSKDVYNKTVKLNAFALDANGNKTDTAIITALINNISQICMDTNKVRDYRVIEPGESVVIPIIFSFVYEVNDEKRNMEDDLELSFDTRLSLYSDPQNYFIKVHRISPSDVNLHGKIIESQTNLTKYNTVIPKVFYMKKAQSKF